MEYHQRCRLTVWRLWAGRRIAWANKIFTHREVEHVRISNQFFHHNQPCSQNYSLSYSAIHWSEVSRVSRWPSVDLVNNNLIVVIAAHCRCRGGCSIRSPGLLGCRSTEVRPWQHRHRRLQVLVSNWQPMNLDLFTSITDSLGRHWLRRVLWLFLWP